MAKRFTDSNKWEHPWFRKLPIKIKALWIYILDSCDNAGVWKKDLGLATFFIGEEITEEDFTNYLGDKVKQLSKYNFHILGFIEFQYGTLSPGSRAHQAVLRKLRDYGIASLYGDESSIEPHYKRSDMGDSKADRIRERDQFTCQYCGHFGKVGIDHVIPVSSGGTNDESNLVACCFACNQKKNSKPLEEFVKSIDVSKCSRNIHERLSKNYESSPPPKDKEQDKEKDKEKEKEQEKDKEAPDTAHIAKVGKFTRSERQWVIQTWLETLRFFKMGRANLLPDEDVRLGTAIMRYGAKSVVFALIGARYQTKTETYDPAKFVNLERYLAKDRFQDLLNLGVQAVQAGKAALPDFGSEEGAA